MSHVQNVTGRTNSKRQITMKKEATTNIENYDPRRNMRRKGKKYIGLLTLMLITLMFSISSAEIPESINFKGFLTESGSPIDETVKMTFSLYNSESAESPFWSQSQVIEVKKGLYSIVINSFPNKVLLGAQYYLGVEVGTEHGSICLGRNRLAMVRSGNITSNYSL